MDIDLEELRDIIEDKLIDRGMDEDIAIAIADEVVQHFFLEEDQDGLDAYDRT